MIWMSAPFFCVFRAARETIMIDVKVFFGYFCLFIPTLTEKRLC